MPCSLAKSRIFFWEAAVFGLSDGTLWSTIQTSLLTSAMCGCFNFVLYISMVSFPSSLDTYSWVDCSLPPKYKNSSQLPTMDSHSFSNSFLSWAKFWMIIETDISRLRIVERSLSNSSGRATLANSSITKCTWTGNLPPCFTSAL